MRTNLQVPFAEKDEAKALGARWDPGRRTWYVQNVADLGPFARWMSGGAEAGGAPAGGAPARKLSQASVVKTGAAFIELACDCLPWEGCARCREALQARGWRVR